MQGTMARMAWLVSAVTVGLVGAARAQGQAPAAHTHASPHGGEIAEVADHHVEFKADSTGSISVWLLDAHEKTVTAPSGASVTLIDATGTQVTLPLQVDATAQRLDARFDPRKLTTFQAIVSMPIAGTKHNLRFRYPAHH